MGCTPGSSFFFLNGTYTFLSANVPHALVLGPCLQLLSTLLSCLLCALILCKTAGPECPGLNPDLVSHSLGGSVSGPQFSHL